MCSSQAATGSQFCATHQCACGGTKSSSAPKCERCIGASFGAPAPTGVRSPPPPLAHPGAKPKGDAAGGNGTAGGEKETKKDKEDATFRIDEPGPDEPPFDLERELAQIVGLDGVKAEIRALAKELTLDARRAKMSQGQGGNTSPATATPTGSTREKEKEVQLPSRPLHMVFKGNPGTGKTSVARLLARMLHSIGYLPRPRMVETQRADLVAEYVGQTAVKTKKAVTAAKGGVLFVDEAYRLSRSTTHDFGVEAIEELMAAMGGSQCVLVLAGYPALMDGFIECNPGLFRRVRKTFTFPDYTPQELGDILRVYVEKHNFRLGTSLAAPGVLARLIYQNTTPTQRARLNGGLAEFIFDGAKRALDSELSENDPEPSVVLEARHIVAGCQAAPTPPPPSNGSATSPTATITPATSTITAPAHLTSPITKQVPEFEMQSPSLQQQMYQRKYESPTNAGCDVGGSFFKRPSGRVVLTNGGQQRVPCKTG
jgi:hypothetical protein